MYVMQNLTVFKGTRLNYEHNTIIKYNEPTKGSVGKIQFKNIILTSCHATMAKIASLKIYVYISLYNHIQNVEYRTLE